MPPSSPSAAARPHRFYKAAAVAPRDDLFTVLLDGRGVKTPAGAPLLLPTAALAQLIAGEWTAQGAQIDLMAMPANRLASTVIDRTASAGSAVAAEVARYAASDVLCYPAEAPGSLVQAQREGWDPILAWARDALDIDLQPVRGALHSPQSPEALARVEALAAGLEPFVQAGVAYAAPLFGSAVLALAVQAGRLEAEAAFGLSRLEEAFQEQQWGVDADAAARTEALRQEARLLDRWFKALT